MATTTIIVKARYIGEDGLHGFHTGQIYTLAVGKRDNQIWIDNYAIDSGVWIFESFLEFLKHFEDVREEEQAT